MDKTNSQCRTYRKTPRIECTRDEVNAMGDVFYTMLDDKNHAYVEIYRKNGTVYYNGMKYTDPSQYSDELWNIIDKGELFDEEMIETENMFDDYIRFTDTVTGYTDEVMLDDKVYDWYEMSDEALFELAHTYVEMIESIREEK